MKPLLLTALVLSLTVGCASTGVTDDQVDAESNASAPGKIDLWQSSDTQWRFHVVSGNGRILLASEGYTSRTGALGGVLSVLDNGVDPAQYELNQTASGRYNLRLRAANFEIIAFTQAYSSKSNATRAITSCVRAITSYLDTIEANTSGARVELFAGTTGQFHFNLYAQNGESVLTSESYSTKAAAWNGAFAVQDAAANDGAFTLQTSSNNLFYFTVKANNGEIVGVSQMYTTAAAARGGIESVKSVMSSLDLI